MVGISFYFVCEEYQQFFDFFESIVALFFQIFLILITFKKLLRKFLSNTRIGIWKYYKKKKKRREFWINLTVEILFHFVSCAKNYYFFFSIFSIYEKSILFSQIFLILITFKKFFYRKFLLV